MNEIIAAAGIIYSIKRTTNKHSNGSLPYQVKGLLHKENCKKTPHLEEKSMYLVLHITGAPIMSSTITCPNAIVRNCALPNWVYNFIEFG